MRSFFYDLRLAVRSLARRPAFAATAVGVLAVAVGHGGELRVVGMFPERGEPISLSLPDFFDLRRELAPVAQVAAAELQAASWIVDGAAERTFAGIVSSNYFDTLGLRPQLGTFFVADDDRPGATATAVLSDKAWRRKFDADPAIVGRTVELNKRSFVIAGVAPAGFVGTEVGLSLDLWVPLGSASLFVPWAGDPTARDNHWIRGIARLRDGVDARNAQAGADRLSAQLAAAYPDRNRDYRFRLMSLTNAPWGATHFLAPVLGVVGAMVLLVVAATAANVAGLMLVRSRERRRELAVRLALGADQRRLLGPLVAENLLLALAALAVGSTVLPASKRIFLSFLPPVPVPVDPTMEVGAAGVAFGVALALVTALLASFAPALEQRRVTVDRVLREEATRTSSGRRHRRFRDLLVVAQVGLGFVLIATGALFLRAVGVGQDLSPGFRADHLLLADVDLFPLGYDDAEGTRFLNELRDRIAGDPGVVSASLTRRLPLDLGGSSSSPIGAEGYTPAPGETNVVRFDQVGVDFFSTAGIDLVAGRPFTAEEVAGGDGAERVAIVSRAMADRYWHDRDAVGGTLLWGERRVRVVGIAADIPWRERDEAPIPFFYVPFGQSYRPGMTLLVRTTGEPLAFAPRLRELVAAADPALPLAAVKSMQQHLEISLIKQRLAATMLTMFGGVALLLAIVGLYGVVALTLRQRLRELALRSALGAAPGDLVRLTVAHGMWNAALGLLLGGIAAAGLATAMRSLLLGLPRFDPTAWLAALVVLGSGAALASWLPARRAARLDPAAVLRQP